MKNDISLIDRIKPYQYLYNILQNQIQSQIQRNIQKAMIIDTSGYATETFEITLNEEHFSAIKQYEDLRKLSHLALMKLVREDIGVYNLLYVSKSEREKQIREVII